MATAKKFTATERAAARAAKERAARDAWIAEQRKKFDRDDLAPLIEHMRAAHARWAREAAGGAA